MDSALDAGGEPRDDADVTEWTGLVGLKGAA
jgi:hypothetical protein